MKNLFAFSTAHSQDLIRENCSGRYCSGMQWLSTAACKKLNHIFTKDKKILNDVGTAALQLYQKSYSAADCTNPAHGNSCYIISSQQDIEFGFMMSQLDAEYVSKQDFSGEDTLKFQLHEAAILEQFLQSTCAFSYQVGRIYNFVF